MSGTVVRLIVVGVAFILLALFPPSKVFELNLAAFLTVIFAALVAEVFFASRTVDSQAIGISTQVETFRRRSRINTSLRDAPAPTPTSAETRRRRQVPASYKGDAPYDPIAASRLTDYYAPPAPPPRNHGYSADDSCSTPAKTATQPSFSDYGSSSNCSDSSSSSSDGGGGGGD